MSVKYAIPPNRQHADLLWPQYDVPTWGHSILAFSRNNSSTQNLYYHPCIRGRFIATFRGYFIIVFLHTKMDFSKEHIPSEKVINTYIQRVLDQMSIVRSTLLKWNYAIVQQDPEYIRQSTRSKH